MTSQFFQPVLKKYILKVGVVCKNVVLFSFDVTFPPSQIMQISSDVIGVAIRFGLVRQANLLRRTKHTKPPYQRLSPPLFTCTEQLSNHHGAALPPVPPPHRQQPSITALNHSLSSAHHAGQSLNSTRQLTPPTGSPAPVAGQSPAELQATPPESVPLQDSWVLGSNVPLETR